MTTTSSAIRSPKSQESLADQVPDRTQQIRIKNRRKLYLDRHPSYFNTADHELADPLLYDALIRRFLSPSEREAAGRKKGYSGVLEADLYRSEARLAALSSPENTNRSAASANLSSPSSSRPRSTTTKAPAEAETDTRPTPMTNPLTGLEGEDAPRSKAEGEAQWHYYLEQRFLRGEDEDFDYAALERGDLGVDDGGLESVEEEERVQRWIEDDEEGWASGVGGGGEGETGVQDF